MKIEQILEEIFDLLSKEKSAYYVVSSKEEKTKCSLRYKIFKDYYTILSNNSSFSYVYKLKNEIKNTYVELESKYKELVGMYEKEEGIDIENLINQYVYKIDAYKEIYNIINKHLDSEKIDDEAYSNNIISLIKDYDYEMDDNILSQLYRLKDERRARISSIYGKNSIKYISILESLEYRMARLNDNKIAPYEVDKDKYVSTLKESILGINDYYFLDYKNSKYYINKEFIEEKFEYFLNRYKSLINSLFENEFVYIENDNGKISSDDLLNYLSIYNMDSNYEEYTRKHKGKIIGGSKFNNEDYLNNVKVLDSYINALMKMAKDKIKDKTITIKDNSITKEELLKTRKELLNNIYSLGEGYARK